MGTGVPIGYPAGVGGSMGEIIMRTERDSDDQRVLRLAVFLCLTVPLIGYCGDGGGSPTGPADVPVGGCDGGQGEESFGVEVVNEDDQRVPFIVGGYSVYVEANSTERYVITFAGESRVTVQFDPDARAIGDEVFLAQTTCTVPANSAGGRIVWDGTTLTCTVW